MTMSDKGIVYIILFLLGACSDVKKEDKRKFSGEDFTANIRTTDARTPEEERLGFKLPEGFEISLFASEPDIDKPINIAFDAKGRVWVTQSFEYPFPSAPGKGKDKLTILEDTDNDGKADKFTVFSDTLNIPIGVLPLNDGAVAYSIPNIYRYIDSNDDGKADSQIKLLGPFKTNDTHGMINNFVRGYDGWIHSCHGYTNRDTVAGADGDSISMISGNTFRFRPNGERVEHTTDGRINPFGLVYDELGYLYSTDCHTSPLYQLIRDADYTQWGKEEGMGFAPEMTPLSDEATALAGIGYYADKLFPEAYQKNFYVGDAVRCRVYRYSGTFKGSTPVGKKEEDFLLSEDPWFRPVDVKLGPDGALYIADFYNSIIGHYEVPLDHPRRDHTRGRIWRITYKGKRNDKKDWNAANINELLHALDMDNMFIRMTAADQLADRIGKEAIQQVTAVFNEKDISTRKYVHALWVLERLGALSPAIIKAAVTHNDPVIRLHAMHILAEKKPDEQQLFPLVLKGLEDKDAHVKRAAVELLKKYPTMRSIELALEIRNTVEDYDTHLLYATRLSLRNILRNDAVMKQVAATQWNEKDAAHLSDVMMGVASMDAGVFLYRYVHQYKPDNKRAPAIFQHIARFAPSEYLDSTIKIAMNTQRPDTVNLFIFQGIQQGIAKKGAKESAQLGLWGKSLAESVLQKNPYDKTQPLSILNLETFAAGVAGNYKLTSVIPQLEAIVKSAATADLKLSGQDLEDVLIDLKVAAVRALIKIDEQKGSAVAQRLLGDNNTDEYFKNVIGRLLGEFPGTVVNGILKNIKNAGPDLQSNIALTLANTAEGKEILFEKVKNKEMFPRILIQPRIKERILIGITPAQKNLFNQLTAGLDPVDQERQKEIYNRLVEFDKAMKTNPPSVDSGRMVFMQNCSTCHSIAEEGGSIGPNLDGVAQWGAKSLAEKILDPNRNVSESFRTYTIRMKDGKVSSGLLRREEGAVIIFADLTGKELIKKKIQNAEANIDLSSLKAGMYLIQIFPGKNMRNVKVFWAYALLVGVGLLALAPAGQAQVSAAGAERKPGLAVCYMYKFIRHVDEIAEWAKTLKCEPGPPLLTA
ncbi:MAG: PVC-type heme-binding CxxCH protein, partial [Flavitalea sp.]